MIHHAAYASINDVFVINIWVVYRPENIIMTANSTLLGKMLGSMIVRQTPT